MNRITVNTFSIIEKYYTPGTLAYETLVRHSKMVAGKALKAAEKVAHMEPDLSFVEEAAMLHDIGILMTAQPGIGCFGVKEYLAHGYLGRELLEREGLTAHALVCERHVGAGISLTEIERGGLPLPKRDMLPITIEEKIVCYADKFFSKKISALGAEKEIDEVRASIRRYGREQFDRFEELHRLFGG